jgi:hypothetical protein
MAENVDQESPYCPFCQHVSILEGMFACSECQDKLEVLMKVTKVLDYPEYQYEPSIEFKNVRLSSDYPGEAIVAIDGSGAAGMQKAFRFDGQGKCLVCDEVATNSLICSPCKGAISVARKIMTDSAGEFLHLFQDEGFIALLRFVSSNAVRKYMEAEIDGFGEA